MNINKLSHEKERFFDAQLRQLQRQRVLKFMGQVRQLVTETNPGYPGLFPDFIGTFHLPIAISRDKRGETRPWGGPKKLEAGERGCIAEKLNWFCSFARHIFNTTTIRA